jgi:hypothetical protein
LLLKSPFGKEGFRGIYDLQLEGIYGKRYMISLSGEALLGEEDSRGSVIGERRVNGGSGRNLSEAEGLVFLDEVKRFSTKPTPSGPPGPLH